jgi:glutaredoxin
MIKMDKVIVYSKTDCHLCERVLRELEKLGGFEVTVRDITTDAKLFERYKNIIPVVSINERIVFTAESLARSVGLTRALREALDTGVKKS